MKYRFCLVRSTLIVLGQLLLLELRVDCFGFSDQGFGLHKGLNFSNGKVPVPALASLII